MDRLPFGAPFVVNAYSKLAMFVKPPQQPGLKSIFLPDASYRHTLRSLLSPGAYDPAVPAQTFGQLVPGAGSPMPGKYYKFEINVINYCIK